MFKTFLLVLALGIGLGACDSKPELNPLAELVLLVEEGRNGDPQAIQEILACLDNSPHYDGREWAQYYWLLALKRAGLDVKEERLFAAKTAVNPEDVWKVEEWHLLPGSYPPFTIYEEVKC